MTQTQKTHEAVEIEEEAAAMPAKTAEQRAKDQALKDDLDDLLDEIDLVLEENAQAFVQGFVQRNGE